MRTPLVSLSMVAAFAICAAAFRVAPSASPQSTKPPTDADGAKLLARVPVAFVPNLGQWDASAHSTARFGAMTVFLHEKGWTFTLEERGTGRDEGVLPRHSGLPADCDPKPSHGIAVRMSFLGADAPELACENRLPGHHNYFLGNDPSKWHSDVPLYGSVCYRHIYAGVDVRVREHGGHLEYDLMLEPHARLEPIEMSVTGIERMYLDDAGALVMETTLGPVHMPAPTTWEEAPSGERNPVLCKYVLRGENRFGFEVNGRQPGWTLTVDPGLVWSTFVGGADLDVPHALAVDALGATTVLGVTRTTNFPTTPGAFDPSINGSDDVFVTRFSPTGANLVYSTFLGGSGLDVGCAIALDAQGGATVSGRTQSSNFPATPGAFATSSRGGTDGFVTRLSPTGSTLVYSTLLGGSNHDFADAVAIDAQGTATVTGQTASSDFPTTPGAFDTSFNGGSWDGYVARLSPNGSSLVYSTFFGGTSDDSAHTVAIDAQGTATVAGDTSSTDFPTTAGAWSVNYNGGLYDGFVVRLSPTGASLVYSTFLGGDSSDFVLGLVVDAGSAATVTGWTRSTNFPTTPGAFDTSFGGGFGASDAFVLRLAPNGSSLVFSTFLGGGGDDEGYAVAVDAQGATVVTGATTSPNFPTTPGAFDTSFNSSTAVRDAFIARLSPTGASLVYSTFLGGLGNDIGYALALDAKGMASVAGFTESIDFPTTPGAYSSRNGGGYSDVFVTRLDLLPIGVTAFGSSSPGCTGPLAISVNSMPRLGNAGFALTCGNGPPSASGLCALTANSFSTPVPVLGVEIWVDPSPVLVWLTANSNGIGASFVSLPIPGNAALAGGRLFAQFLWVGPTAPPPCPALGWSASNALAVVLQP